LTDLQNRRELATRKVQFFQKLAKFCVGTGLKPNHVSVLSAVFGFVAGVGFFLANYRGSAWYLLLAGAGIQLRLLCNMIDGLMAVENGLKTPTGELFNDVPDRISDAFIIVGFGLSAPSGWTAILGFVAALGAVMTAYVRVLGASMGAGHFFSGPMAKQHRMFLLTVACIAWAVENGMYQHSKYTVFYTLWIIVAGTFVTCWRRLAFISKKLNGK
jgi:phosphatidylglycerophosphate synthase